MLPPNPKVSCLMVTQKGREKFVAKAIENFIQQRYENRELVIISEDTTQTAQIAGPLVTRLNKDIKKPPGSNIRCFSYPSSNTILGALRNHSIECSTGDVIATWDDDDHRVPNFLTIMVNKLLKARYGDSGQPFNKKPVAIFLDQIRLRCICGQSVRSAERRWECTMVAERDGLPKYKALSKQEDSVFVRDLDQVAGYDLRDLEGASHLYEKRYHGVNTWGPSHNRALFMKGTPAHLCKELFQ